jgi:hypothetical protein
LIEESATSGRSVDEFADDLRDLDVTIRPPRTEQIAVRLYEDDLQALRSLAAERGMGHTTLARTSSKDGSRSHGGKPARRAAGTCAARSRR